VAGGGFWCCRNVRVGCGADYELDENLGAAPNSSLALPTKIVKNQIVLHKERVGVRVKRDRDAKVGLH
jgi:hypothetical protein